MRSLILGSANRNVSELKEIAGRLRVGAPALVSNSAANTRVDLLALAECTSGRAVRWVSAIASAKCLETLKRRHV